MTRAVPADMAAALATGCTRFCRCWQVLRSDGVLLGFTDHDRDLDFDGVTHRAASALEGSAAETSTGLSIDTMTVQGALISDAITAGDIARGLYDNALVRQWLVDWEDPSRRLLLAEGRIGEIRSSGKAFEAEVVGIAERLNRPLGRAFLRRCDARFGDARCGVDLAQPAYRVEAEVVASDGARLTLSGIGGYEAGLFTAGRLSWLSGENAPVEQEIRHHGALDSVIETWTAAPFVPQPGDRCQVEAGCDKTAGTCRGRFQNFANFRGFPHMPGDDWAAGYPEEGGVHDGGSLNRG